MPTLMMTLVGRSAAVGAAAAVGVGRGVVAAAARRRAVATAVSASSSYVWLSSRGGQERTRGQQALLPAQTTRSGGWSWTHNAAGRNKTSNTATTSLMMLGLWTGLMFGSTTTKEEEDACGTSEDLSRDGTRAPALSTAEDLERIRVAATAALRGNRLQDFKELVREAKHLSGGDVELRDSIGRSLSMLAAGLGKLQALKFLLREGADARAVDQHGLTLLEHASWKDQVFVVQYLLHDVKMHPDQSCDMFGLYPLHKAAGYGNANVLQQLLDAGADVNQPTAESTAPPSYEAGSKLETALAIASRLGYHDAMRTLLSTEGCRVNQADRHGDTPLHHALRKGDWRATELLVSAGADPSLCNGEQKTGLAVASSLPLALAVRTRLIRLFPTRVVQFLDPA
ncbi:hypothetical protein PTSG_08162 [Salpingoeca rosetta]|uniref:Uncharacterized protein n=1 Tax=Salpingoeca rosetta (strain ATCC 50818 / BSB-021) TaxID=946362 RepID=F2UI65_SALR5|nr:uncharacterized protein PTSG_08162 [Salpingoeca rosetta]EGD76814.1 hypothetical protein PTSG_08162 [Salpingoeca rosetta]|eukprot:XP_004991186.1 hypothetical protein PTSG_08162 [Salpingoeca rosetta]